MTRRLGATTKMVFGCRKKKGDAEASPFSETQRPQNL
jgi:hypothetical protein